MTGRKALFLIIIGMTILFSVLFRTFGADATWRFWNIPAATPPFIDLRILTGSAESFRQGFDPIEQNPGDPLGRHFNLGKIWYLIFYTGIKQEDTLWLGTLLALGFLFCVWAFPHRINLTMAGLLALVLFSPSTMLALERGNVDLFIFILCTVALTLLESVGWFAMFFLILAALLKLYPIFGFAAFLEKQRTRFWFFSLSALVILLVYAVLTFSNIAASFSYTEKGGDLSYGVNVISLYLQPLFASQQIYGLLTFVAYLIVLCIAVIVVLTGMRYDPLIAGDAYHLAAFRLGAAIYIGTFFLGTNWDYRLIFLIFTVPQLCTWMMSSRIVRWTLAALILSCWYLITLKIFGWLPYGVEFAYILDQVCKWGLFAGLLFLFVRSSPDWLMAELAVALAGRGSS